MADLDSKFLRVIDANFNRAKEGLRVCEDVCRFWLNDTAMTKKLKDLRHRLTTAIGPLGLKEMIAGRDVDGDVGRKSSKSESRRERPSDIFYANSQRVKESLRVLEEFSKLRKIKTAQAIKAMRYEFYIVEKKVLTSRTFNAK